MALWQDNGNAANLTSYRSQITTTLQSLRSNLVRLMRGGIPLVEASPARDVRVLTATRRRDPTTITAAGPTNLTAYFAPLIIN